MKIALLNDTHFGARNDSLPFNDYFYKFWEEIFFPLIDKKGIDTIIHLGDTMADVSLYHIRLQMIFAHDLSSHL